MVSTFKRERKLIIFMKISFFFYQKSFNAEKIHKSFYLDINMFLIANAFNIFYLTNNVSLEEREKDQI